MFAHAMTQISSGNNNDDLIGNIGKFQQEIPQHAGPGFNLQDFSGFGHSSLDFRQEISVEADRENARGDNNFALETRKDMHITDDKLDKDSNPSSPTSSEDDCDIKMELTEPFCKDMNAVSTDLDVVVTGDSIERARECITYGTKTPTYFKCQHCRVVMDHPKRFLIHVKWHTFGLTNERRQRQLHEIETLRTKRRREKLAERLSRQEAKDESEANYPCRDCDKIFIRNSSLKRHRVKFHPKKGPITECKICFAPVNNTTELRAHMSTHKSKDGASIQRFQCPECPKRYKFTHSLVKHMDTHLEKKYPCSICSKLFGSESQLSRHIKLHEKKTKGANYHCAYCGKSYYDSFTLQVHERNHTQERPFTCDTCNAAFSTNSSLNRHKKVSHSSSKPYPCDECGRSFSTCVTRDRHALRTHADPACRPHHCSLCECRYLKPKDLRNHMYKAHPEERSSTTDTDIV